MAAYSNDFEIRESFAKIPNSDSSDHNPTTETLSLYIYSNDDNVLVYLSSLLDLIRLFRSRERETSQQKKRTPFFSLVPSLLALLLNLFDFLNTTRSSLRCRRRQTEPSLLFLLLRLRRRCSRLRFLVGFLGNERPLTSSSSQRQRRHERAHSRGGSATPIFDDRRIESMIVGENARRRRLLAREFGDARRRRWFFLRRRAEVFALGRAHGRVEIEESGEVDLRERRGRFLICFFRFWCVYLFAFHFAAFVPFDGGQLRCQIDRRHGRVVNAAWK